MEKPDSFTELIEAESVTLEVIDKNTGRVYKRTLPITYKESDNGIILKGENASGIESDLVFLSDTALTRINDVIGKGPDIHRCD